MHGNSATAKRTPNCGDNERRKRNNSSRLLYTTTDQHIGHRRRHGSAAAAAGRAGSDGDGTVAMLCVVIDPNSWRGGASHEHNQPGRAGPDRAVLGRVSVSQPVSSTKE